MASADSSHKSNLATSSLDSNTTTNSSMNVLLQSVAKTQEYLQDHPYCLASYIRISEHFRQLGFPDVAAGAAYKALLLADAIEDESDEYYEAANSDLSEFLLTLPADHEYRHCGASQDTSTGDGPQEKLIDLVLRQKRPSIYRQLISSLTLCGCFKTAGKYYLQGSIQYPDNDSLKQVYAELRDTVANHYNILATELDTNEQYRVVNWPDTGYVRREVYPWNKHEPDRLQELDTLNELLAEVAPKLEVKVINLPSLAPQPENGDVGVVQQFGVFAKEDVEPHETILDETSMLTANNRLQDALCDACSADLPSLDLEESNHTVRCPDCEVVFCDPECYDAAIGSYHPAVCEMDVEGIAKDVPSAQAAESLYSLLLLRAMAMAETQHCHPLDLKEVKYIWGDFHTVPIADQEYPMTDSYYRSQKVVKTLPFSFEHNIRLPFHMLEKMDIDIFANSQYDVWVFNTLYAKFRGTASARLSGSTGSAVRGPEVGAVHPMWCLANHSCDPNVSWEWGGSIKFWVRDLRATWKRDMGEEHRSASGVKKGEEILNHYCDIELQVHERREWMRGTLGGDCRCARCVWEARETAS